MTPAFLMSTSTLPNLAAAPAGVHSRSVASSRAWSTSQMATLAPAARKAVAVAVPRLPPAPVMMTVVFSVDIIFFGGGGGS